MSEALSPLEQLIRAEVRAQRPRLMIATAAAIGVTCGAALLLGLSGWFIAAAARVWPDRRLPMPSTI